MSKKVRVKQPSTAKRVIVNEQKGIYQTVDDPLASMNWAQKWIARRIGLDTALSGSIPGRGTGEGTQETRLFGGDITNSERMFAVERTPAGHRIVFMVAHDIFDKWFTLKNVTKENDVELDKYVQKALNDLHAKDVFTRMAVFERAFGWAVIVLGYDDDAETLKEPLVSAKALKDIDTYGEESITQIEEVKDHEDDRNGLPLIYRLFGRSSLKKQDIHYTRCIHVATRLWTHRYKGISVLDPIYDDMLSLRYISWGAAMAMFRYGGGFPVIKLHGAKQSKIDAFIDSGQMDNVNAMKYFVGSDKQTIEFAGMAGKALDPKPYYQIPIERISMGSNIPTNVLRGAQAGALTGSQVNEREYFKYISDQQSRYEPAMRELIGIILSFSEKYKETDFKIEWNPGFALNLLDQSIVDVNNERVNAMRSNYMTIDEIRKKNGLGVLPMGAGAVVVGLEKLKSAGGGGFGFEAFDESELRGMERTLSNELENVMERVRRADLTFDQAMLEAEMVVTEKIRLIRQITLHRISTKAGRPISEVGPEAERQFANMKTRYLSFFRKILEDGTLT